MPPDWVQSNHDVDSVHLNPKGLTQMGEEPHGCYQQLRALFSPTVGSAQILDLHLQALMTEVSATLLLLMLCSG